MFGGVTVRRAIATADVPAGAAKAKVHPGFAAGEALLAACGVRSVRHRELEMPAQVLDDVLLLAGGNLAKLIRISRSAVLDFRDIRMAADSERAKSR